MQHSSSAALVMKKFSNYMDQICSDKYTYRTNINVFVSTLEFIVKSLKLVTDASNPGGVEFDGIKSGCYTCFDNIINNISKRIPIERNQQPNEKKNDICVDFAIQLSDLQSINCSLLVLKNAYKHNFPDALVGFNPIESFFEAVLKAIPD